MIIIILSRIEGFFFLFCGFLCFFNFILFLSVEVFGKMCFGFYLDIYVIFLNIEFFLFSVFEMFMRIFIFFLVLVFLSVLYVLVNFIFKRSFYF